MGSVFEGQLLISKKKRLSRAARLRKRELFQAAQQSSEPHLRALPGAKTNIASSTALQLRSVWECSGHQVGRSAGGKDGPAAILRWKQGCANALFRGTAISREDHYLIPPTSPPSPVIIRKKCSCNSRSVLKAENLLLNQTPLLKATPAGVTCRPLPRFHNQTRPRDRPMSNFYDCWIFKTFKQMKY